MEGKQYDTNISRTTNCMVQKTAGEREQNISTQIPKTKFINT